MSKCPRHGIDYVYRPKFPGLKASNWICTECKKEQDDFFSSIAEVRPFTAEQAEAQKNKYIEKLVASQRESMEGIKAGLLKAEQQREELLVAARYVAADLHSRGIVYPALDEAIAKAGE